MDNQLFCVFTLRKVQGKRVWEELHCAVHINADLEDCKLEVSTFLHAAEDLPFKWDCTCIGITNLQFTVICIDSVGEHPFKCDKCDYATGGVSGEE